MKFFISFCVLICIAKNTTAVTINNGLTEVTLGFNNRVESAVSTLKRNAPALTQGTSTNGVTQTFAALMGNPNDDAGHVLAKSLGGSGIDTRNIIPLTVALNRGTMKSLETDIRRVLRTQCTQIEYTVTPNYATATATRPDTVTYDIHGTGCNRIAFNQFGTAQN